MPNINPANSNREGYSAGVRDIIVKNELLLAHREFSALVASCKNIYQAVIAKTEQVNQRLGISSPARANWAGLLTYLDLEPVGFLQEFDCVVEGVSFSLRASRKFIRDFQIEYSHPSRSAPNTHPAPGLPEYPVYYAQLEAYSNLPFELEACMTMIADGNEFIKATNGFLDIFEELSSR